jgi:hypothetical protein
VLNLVLNLAGWFLRAEISERTGQIRPWRGGIGGESGWIWAAEAHLHAWAEEEGACSCVWGKQQEEETGATRSGEQAKGLRRPGELGCYHLNQVVRARGCARGEAVAATSGWPSPPRLGGEEMGM